MDANKDTLILHIAREPHTGVWAFIKELASWQNQQANLVCKIVIFACEEQHDYYVNEASACGVGSYFFPIANFKYSYWLLLLDQRLRSLLYRNLEFRKYKKIILQFHNANLSGLFLPIKETSTLKLRSIAVFHGTPMVFPQPGRLKLKLHQMIGRRLKYADKIVSVSENGMAEAVRIFSYRPEQFCVITNGVADQGIIHKLNRSHHQTSPFVIGFLGSLTVGKRWDLVIAAVEGLYKKGYPVKAIIAGTGPGESEIKTMARIHPEWLDYRGFIPGARKTLLPLFDVLVLPSSYEGTPMTIIEALACGVPVISTAISDIPKMIAGELKAGYLVKPDAGEIADRIECLINDKDLYEQLSNNARQKYSGDYTIAICGKRYTDLYEELF